MFYPERIIGLINPRDGQINPRDLQINPYESYILHVYDMPLDVRGEDKMPVDGDSATVRTASGGLTDIDHGEAESHTENPLLQTADVMEL